MGIFYIIDQSIGERINAALTGSLAIFQMSLNDDIQYFTIAEADRAAYEKLAELQRVVGDVGLFFSSLPKMEQTSVSVGLSGAGQIVQDIKGEFESGVVSVIPGTTYRYIPTENGGTKPREGLEADLLAGMDIETARKKYKKSDAVSLAKEYGLPSTGTELVILQRIINHIENES